MKTIGTVLPTQKSLAATDRYAKQVATVKNRVGRNLRGCKKRNVGGEVRHYRTTNEYAVVNASGNVLWFETREDGYDYAL